MPVLEATSNLLTTSNVLSELHSARAESDRLFQILTSEGMYQRPIAERHRVIFYVGHFDGFDSIQICREALGLESPDRQFDDLFQAGIDPDSAHLPSDTPADWPSMAQVQQYVARCREHVDRNIERAPEEVVLLALEHRQMHLETLAYMFHNFDYRMKHVAAAERLENHAGQSPSNSWVEIPAGVAVLGQQRGRAFGWDNEFGETDRSVPGFSHPKKQHYEWRLSSICKSRRARPSLLAQRW